MICENAYYPNGTGENREKLYCKQKEVINDEFSKGKCPLIYWCSISEKFENTTDMFGCIYRENDNDRQ